MANISYIAAGKKNSKKNPAIMTLNIALECGETVSIDLVYTARKGWFPADNTSARAAYLYCAYVTHDRCWNDETLQNYINGYFNSATSWNKQAASLKWMEHYAAWKYNENKGGEVIVWAVQK
jgi:hypothetical protein